MRNYETWEICDYLEGSIITHADPAEVSIKFEHPVSKNTGEIHFAVGYFFLRNGEVHTQTNGYSVYKDAKWEGAIGMDAGEFWRGVTYA